MTKRQWCGYVRVSRVGGRDGEAFMSPEIQRDAINRMVHATGGTSGPVFEDIDRTGRDFDRAGIQAALGWVMERPATRGLATYDASRLGRNVSESLDVVKGLRAAGAAYASAQENVDDSPEGVLALTIWLAMAEHYSAKVGVTWRTVHASRAARGLPHGTPPLGYVLRDRRAVADPETAPGVVEVFERYARGETLKAVAARLGEVRGGGHVPTQNAKRLLRSRFYVGEIRYRGEWLPGEHERLVDEVLWERVQLRLAGESGQAPARAEPRSFLLGLLRCDGCGGGVQVINRGRGPGRGRGSLACTSFRKRYPGDRTCTGFGTPPLEQVEELCVVTLIEAGRVALDRPGRRAAPSRVVALEDEVEALRAGRGRLAAALARGSLGDEAFDLAMKQVDLDLADAERRLADARRDETVAPAALAGLLDTLGLLVAVSASEGRTMLREVVSEIRVRRTSEPRPFARWEGELTPVWR